MELLYKLTLETVSLRFPPDRHKLLTQMITYRSDCEYARIMVARMTDPMREACITGQLVHFFLSNGLCKLIATHLQQALC